MDDAIGDPSGAARRLQLVRPRDLTLRGERGLSEAFQARFEGRLPVVEERGATVAVIFPRLARRDGAATTITLDASVPWQIEAAGPVRRLVAGLGVLTLLGFEVTWRRGRPRPYLPKRFVIRFRPAFASRLAGPGGGQRDRAHGGAALGLRPGRVRRHHPCGGPSLSLRSVCRRRSSVA